MRLTKSFRLMRLLNLQPIWPLRAICAAIGWLGGLVFTQNLTLAGHIASLFWHEPTLKNPVRMLAWYGARSVFRLELLADPVFDFAKGLSDKQRNAQIRFLARSRRTPLEQNLDQLTQIAGEVAPPMTAVAFDTVLARFADTAAAVFDALAAQPDVAPPPDMPARVGDFAVADARLALQDFAKLYPNDQVPWYIISGTFLGLVREGGFLPHDYDIDLGINAEDADLHAIAETARNSAEFALVANDDLHVFARHSDQSLRVDRLPILLKLVHRTGVHIDLFVHYLDGDQRWHGSYVHRWNNIEFSREPHLFEGVNVLAPSHPDVYLRENYGDWRTPVTDFSPSTGTPNLTVVHNLASIVLTIKRYALARGAGDPLAERMIEALIKADYAKRTEAGIRLDMRLF